jgi:SPP1 family predicted phage head-tail adaptor
MIAAGPRNRRISIQSQSTTQDAAGGPLQAWTTAYKCWASIEIQNSQLIYSTAEFMAKAAYRITILWTSSVVITPNMRVVYKEPTTGVVHTYEIESLLNTKQANRELVIMAYELGGDS